MRVDLVENGEPVERSLPVATGTALAATGFLDARPVPGSGMWSLRPQSKVGVVAVPGLEVHVAPKIPVARVVFLLESSVRGVTWRDEEVQVEHADDLLLAVVESFERLTARALRHGLLQGYRTVDEALPLVRGRLREADQIRTRFARPLPVEVRHDEFTVDTSENRLLRAAATVARRLPTLTADLRRRLLRLDVQLADVAPVVARAGLEPWRPTRLNARFHSALRLAEVLAGAASFEPGGAGLAVSGFVIDMARVFEDFVGGALAERLAGTGARVSLQHPCHLDHGRAVAMKPDLVWCDPVGRVRGVVDAKYKAERPAGFPNADVYQLLAYCTALRLPVGHLVYARGNEAGRDYVIPGADVTVRAHALDLWLPPAELLAAVDQLAASLAAAA